MIGWYFSADRILSHRFLPVTMLIYQSHNLRIWFVCSCRVECIQIIFASKVSSGIIHCRRRTTFMNHDRRISDSSMHIIVEITFRWEKSDEMENNNRHSITIAHDLFGRFIEMYRIARKVSYFPYGMHSINHHYSIVFDANESLGGAIKWFSAWNFSSVREHVVRSL